MNMVRSGLPKPKRTSWSGRSIGHEVKADSGNGVGVGGVGEGVNVGSGVMEGVGGVGESLGAACDVLASRVAFPSTESRLGEGWGSTLETPPLTCFSGPWVAQAAKNIMVTNKMVGNFIIDTSKS
jgi:hypothetical protein